MRRLSFVLALIIAVSVLWPTPVVAQTAPDYPHAFPREGVTKRFENERVIIWEVLFPNGVPQPFHRHRYDMTGVFLRFGPIKVTKPDGTFIIYEEPSDLVPPRVFLQRNRAPREGVTHKEEGIGVPERHSIMIDLKEYAPPLRESPADVQPAFPRDGATQMLKEDRVVIWDMQLEEGQGVPLHVHNTDTVVVFLDGGTIRLTNEDGTVATTTFAYKDVRYWSAGRTHSAVVVNGTPRAILFKLQD